MATHPSLAAPASLGNYRSERISFAAASTVQTPELVQFNPVRLPPAFSPRKERVANIMMIAGGVCLTVGIPLIIYAAIEDKKERQASTLSNGFPRSLAFGLLGGIATGVGLGLSIPGAILWHRNHGRVRGVQ